MKNSSRRPTVGRLLANRLPTAYQQVTKKYVCGKLDVQRVLVAVVAKVANSICDFSNRC